MRLLRPVLSTALAVGLLAPLTTALPAAAAHPPPDDVPHPELVARATLSADFSAPGPDSGALATPANGRTGPFTGQVIPGFSAMVDDGDGTFLAMPDNGFGAKGNSADFLLRLYHVTPDWETAEGGSGEINVGEHVSLRDPDHHIPFPIVNGETDERLLTGDDFDIESLVRAPDGSLWIGEEFGPFLLHVDPTGALLAPPVPFLDGKSPANPLLHPGEVPVVPSSRGFEALAASPDGSTLYPIVEGAFSTDPVLRRRYVYEFDTATSTYTGRRWPYQADTDDNVIGDAFMVDDHRMLILERDNFDGPESVTKRVYEIDLSTRKEDGDLAKELVVDLLRIANPAGIGAEAAPDAEGVSDPFAFPFQSVEVVVGLGDGHLLIGNDNNYPGNDARVTGTPDDTEMIVVDLRKAAPGTADGTTMIGHRGASGSRPEHTLAAYQLAIAQCADAIEPDLVPTKDGVLVARHENEIGGTTDIADRPELADRRTTKVIDGVEITGWFTEDLTLAELRTLRAKERIPEVRPANTAYDGLYKVPTFDEVVDLARHSRTCDGRPVGIAPETKHPSYFASIGLPMEQELVRVLHAAGYDDERDPVWLQSFETANLQELDGLTDLRIVQLVSCSGAPHDLFAAGDDRTYADLVTPRGLREIARYADAIGACKDVLIPRTAEGTLAEPTDVLRDAHRRGLQVIGWTFRAENQFLPADLRSSDDPAAHGDLAGELAVFLEAGMDGFFTDHPDVGAAALGR